MSFEAIERHLRDLSIIPAGEEFEPVPHTVQADVESALGRPLPPVLKWLLSTFGGFRLQGGAYYFDPRYEKDVMVGWFFDASELTDALESFGEALPKDVVAVANDGGDNLLAVGVGAENGGVVYFYEHGIGTGERGRPPVYRVADSLEQFLLSLHRES